jgi:hypothetical protein
MDEIVLKGIQGKVTPTQEDVTELDWLQAEETPAPATEEETTEE